MALIRLSDRVSSVGVLNPGLRVFDIVMRTEYGTSYNAYLVKGDEKTALIETVHAEYFDEYLEAIHDAVGDAKIDYLIVNHCEPDHTGSLARLLDKYPDLQVMGSMSSKGFLAEITNRPLNFKVVKDNEVLDLGGVTFRFLSAPFLHWPDSIFTWCEEEKMLFTCDFLGCHYCEPTMFRSRVAYPKAYDEALGVYFNAIFGPFKPYVQAGLKKMEGLDIRYLCPSHGPILNTEETKEVCAKYDEWSKPVVRDHKLIDIFYASAYGCTKAAAEKIAEGISEALADAEVRLTNLCEEPMELAAARIAECDAFLMGSPTINRDAVPPLWELCGHISAIADKGKKCAVFGSYGWSGEAAKLLHGRLEGLALKPYETDFRFRFVPSEAQLAEAKEYGKTVAAYFA